MSQSHRNNLAVKTPHEEALKKELSVGERFRQYYQCYASNPKILRSLINNQLPPKIDLAVRVHVWNCERCRKLYSDLKGLVGSDQILSQNLHSISESGIVEAPVPEESEHRQIAVPEESGHQEIEETAKRCPRCEENLPLTEFGVCRARRDGLNLYCKRCIRQKIALSRQALREYKKARVKYGSSTTERSRLAIDTKSVFSSRRIARMLRKLSPSDRVREAIRCGVHTQKEIAQVTKLPKDEVCDALANLLLWTREIRTQIVRYQRMYFVNEALEDLARPQTATKRGRNKSKHASRTREAGRSKKAAGRSKEAVGRSKK